MRESLKRGRALLSSSKAGLTFFSIKIAGEALTFAIILLLPRFVDQGTFGSFSLAHMLVFLMVILFINAHESPFIVHAAEERKSKGVIRTQFGNQLVILGISVAIGTAGILTLQSAIASFIEVDTALVRSMLVFFYGVALYYSFGYFLMGLDLRVQNAAYALLSGALQLGLLIAIITSGQLTLQAIFWTYFISAIIPIIPFVFIIDRSLLFPLQFSSKAMKAQLRWALWQSGGLAAVYLVNWGDQFIIKLYSSVEDVAVYNVAYQIFKAGVGAAALINSYYLPKLSNAFEDGKALTHFWKVERKRFLAISFIGCIILAIGAPLIFGILYGDQYNASIPLFQILMIALFIQVASIFYGPVLNAAKLYKPKLYINVAVVLINLGLDAVLIPFFGLAGPAIATVIALACGWVFVYVYFKRAGNNHLPAGVQL